MLAQRLKIRVAAERAGRKKILEERMFEFNAPARPFLEQPIPARQMFRRRALTAFGRKGDAFNPQHFTVLSRDGRGGAIAEQTAWYQNPWVWVVGGAVAAGATAGVILVANSRPTGTLPVTIRVNP